MGMPTIQELYRNLKEYELELKRYKKIDDEKKKKTFTLKASNSFDMMKISWMKMIQRKMKIIWLS